MRKLTNEEIEKLASSKNVKKIAVENFLMSLNISGGRIENDMNAEYDARLYNWNYETLKAIKDGIRLSMKEVE